MHLIILLNPSCGWASDTGEEHNRMGICEDSVPLLSSGSQMVSSATGEIPGLPRSIRFLLTISNEGSDLTLPRPKTWPDLCCCPDLWIAAREFCTTLMYKVAWRSQQGMTFPWVHPELFFILEAQKLTYFQRILRQINSGQRYRY